MNKLTAYWRLKKYALNIFLNSYPAADANRVSVKTWLDDITQNPAPATSPEGDLEAKLDLLASARDLASEMTTGGLNPPQNHSRKSRRLLRLVQGTVGVEAGKSGFCATIGDMHPGGGAGNAVGKYYDAAADASLAAAKFLAFVKRDRMMNPTLSMVKTALEGLLTTVPTTPIDPFIKETIQGLVKSIDRFIGPGGGGDGSGYWPSTFISSSSSSGG